jgi:hypothetical protein
MKVKYKETARGGLAVNVIDVLGPSYALHSCE